MAMTFLETKASIEHALAYYDYRRLEELRQMNPEIFDCAVSEIEECMGKTLAELTAR